MNDIEVSSIDLVEGGNVFKQGHYLTLGYVPRDEKGETVDLSGKTLNVSLWGRKGVVFEAAATYSGGVIRFTLDKMVPAGDYTVEFTVTSSTDAKYRKKFPTNQHSGRIAIKQSADDLGVIGISVYTVAQLKAEQKAIQTQYETTLNAKVQATDAKSTTALTKSVNAEAAAQDVKNQFEQVVISGDSSVEAAAARVAPDQTFVSLKARLDAKEQATALQLAETEEQFIDTAYKFIEEANGAKSLDFKNYLGNTQNMHPKVLGFKTPWNGYKYWMAYTPYPFGEATQENPSIAVSHDQVNWLTPPGLSNPLDPYPGVNGTNSDTHLVYREDTNTLEMWWRRYNVPELGQVLFRRTTKDGVNWTEKEAAYTTYGDDLISPAIIFENGIYKIWSVKKAPGHKIRYCESIDSTTASWTVPVELNINYGSFTPWHIDVISTDLGYEMVVSERGINGVPRHYFYILQKRDGSFTKPRVILEVSKEIDAPDNLFMYRASLYKENGVYYLHYSYSGKDGVWGTSLSYGKNIFLLKGHPFDTLGRKVVKLAGNEVLTDYDVRGVEYFIVPAQVSGVGVVFNSFKNMKLGQTITVVLDSTTAKATFKYSSAIWTSGNRDLVIDSTQRIAVMVATPESPINDNLRFTVGATAKVETVAKKEKVPVVLTGNEVLTDYDVSGVSSFIIPHSIAGVGVVFNSFINGEVGQTISVVCRNTSSKATFKYSANRLWTKGWVDYELTAGGTNIATMVCTNIGEFTRFNVL